MPPQNFSPTQTSIDKDVWVALCSAWLIALASTLGALFMGEVLGKTPCALCWYQRIAMFPLALLLAVAAYRDDASIWRYAMPLAATGGSIALYHTLTLYDVVPHGITPCDAMTSCSGEAMFIFANVPIPALALCAFTAILALLGFVKWRTK